MTSFHQAALAGLLHGLEPPPSCPVTIDLPLSLTSVASYYLSHLYGHGPGPASDASCLRRFSPLQDAACEPPPYSSLLHRSGPACHPREPSLAEAAATFPGNRCYGLARR